MTAGSDARVMGRGARRFRMAGRALFLATMPGLSVVNAAVGLLLPALLGPVVFGHYALIVTLFQYGLIFDLGLSQLTDRRVPVLLGTAAPGVLDRFVGQVLWLRLYVAAATMAGGGLVLSVLAGEGRLAFDLLPAILSLAGGLGFMLVLGPAAVYRARSQRRAFGVISIALMLIQAIGRPAGVLADGLVGCFACLAAAYLTMAAATYARLPPRRADRPSLAACLGLLGEGLPLFLTAGVWAFYMTANRWVVSGLAPDIALGQFAFASNAVYLIVGAVGALSQFYYPRITARHATAPPGALSREVTRDFCLLLAAVAVPVGAGIVLGPPLIALFYPKFDASAPAVQILLLAVPSLVVAAWLMPVAISLASRPWIDGLFVYPFALAILLVITRYGYRLDGITGAGVGLTASAQVLLVLQLWTLRTTRLLRPRDAGVLLGATIGATAILVAVLLLAPADAGGSALGITHLWAASGPHR